MSQVQVCCLKVTVKIYNLRYLTIPTNLSVSYIKAVLYKVESFFWTDLYSKQKTNINQERQHASYRSSTFTCTPSHDSDKERQKSEGTFMLTLILC